MFCKCLVHLGKVPQNNGQILKLFLTNNHVDAGKLNRLWQNIVQQKTSLETTRSLQEFEKKA